MKTQNPHMILAAGFTALLAATPAILADEPDAAAPVPPPPSEVAPPPPEVAAPPRGDAPGRPAMDPAAMQQRRFRQYADELKEMFDTDQDGTISPTEKEKMVADLATAERLQRFVMPWRFIREVDADGDLAISDEEAAAIPAAMEKIRSDFDSERRNFRRDNGAGWGEGRGPFQGGFRRGPRPEMGGDGAPEGRPRMPREGRGRRRGPPTPPPQEGGAAPEEAGK